MSNLPMAIRGTGLVTSVGLTSARSCAAFRAKVSNATQTRFLDARGEWIFAHQVELDQPVRGLAKLVGMAVLAVREALAEVPESAWGRLPVILCVAEGDRPGRVAGLDQDLFEGIQSELGIRFAERSTILAQGRVGIASALARARQWLDEGSATQVLVTATDSLLSWPTLSHYVNEHRLLTPGNSNGFLPGEAAGALLVSAATGGEELLCAGIGFGVEAAHIDSGEPLRAEGLTHAFKAALADAGCHMQDMHFRIADNSGEQYYFKEGALAYSRVLRARQEEFDIWHPAECTGEIGAASGATLVAAAWAACSKRYAKGTNILVHMGNDDGQRAALALAYRRAA